MKPKKAQDCDYVVKAVIIGDSGVGKTNILLRYCDNSFKPTYSSTIGVDFKIKLYKFKNTKSSCRFGTLRVKKNSRIFQPRSTKELSLSYSPMP